jgi:hypothetical protein
VATATVGEGGSSSTRRKALKACEAALRQVAEYQLPRALQRNLQRMLERKESLSAAEHQQWLTLVEAVQERSLQTVKSLAAPKRLTEAFPELES